MLLALAAAALTVVVVPDPGASAAGATVRVGTAYTQTAPDGRARLELAPGSYDVVVRKPGFVPVRAHVVVTARGAVARIALHLAPTAALRTIGGVASAERGATNTSPIPVVVISRENYRDQSQPALPDVFTQKPGVATDRASRGLSAADAPPVPLVRGGTPLETQTLLEGDPVALATTRTAPLTAIPTFATQELEVDPGTSAPLPTVDGAINGTLNIRFAEPTPVWRALPEQGFDSRGGSFTDVTGGGATADRRVAFAIAADTSGAHGNVAATDAVSRAFLVHARGALSSASGLTLTSLHESDLDGFGGNRFGFDAAEYRGSGAQSTVLARAWRVSASRDGAAAGDPLETSTDDVLTGGSLEFDRSVGTSVLAVGASETYGTGTANGAVVVAPGAAERVQTAFLRAILTPGPRWQAQLAAYAVVSDATANANHLDEHGLLARAGVSYRVSDRVTLRASSGSGFAPPSLVALAGFSGPMGVETATTDDVGVQARVIDGHTTLSADVFATHGGNRLIETIGPLPWTNGGPFARRGAEFSLARFVSAGFSYLLQAWTASETPALASIGDIASGATHGYAEISYHWANGSRVSLGATYYGRDALLAQPAVLPLNVNWEQQIGERGKIQLDIENLNGVRLGIPTSALPVLAPRNAFAPAPRTLRIVVRRSLGRSGTDG